MKLAVIVRAIGLGGLLLLPGASTPTERSEAEMVPVAPEATIATPLPKGEAPVFVPEPMDEKVKKAVERGLAYLSQRQDPSGGWIQDVGFKFNDSYQITNSNKTHVGVSALALMAFLSAGNLPGRGKYGNVVDKGTDFIVKCVDDATGYISFNETRMYSHAFASLYLAEVYGMTHRQDIQAKLQQATDLTVKSQNKLGSWRYRPFAPDSDMSICVCQLMALRAARNIGIQVPKSTIERAYEYIFTSAYRSGRNKGSFKYQIDQNQTRFSFALTAAGLASLINAGYYEDPMIQPGIDWLKREIDSFNADENYRTYFYWYGHYYCAQVMFTVADKDPDLWNKFYWPRMRDILLRTQSPDGSWENSPGPGSVFGTAVACIILQIPNQYLPIFQR